MSSQQDVLQNGSPPSIPQQPYQQFQQSDIFPSQLQQQQQQQQPLPEQSLQPSHTPHVSPPLSHMFQPELDPQPSLPISIQVPVAALAQSQVDITPMDVLNPQLQQHQLHHQQQQQQQQLPPPLVQDFQLQPSPFNHDHSIPTLDSIDQPHQLLPSSSTASIPSTSHAPSPPLPGMPAAPSYVIGSSSLASALDSMAASRSRSGSSASPGILNGQSPDHSFSSTGSGPPTSDLSLTFTPGFEHILQQSKENSPDVPADSHLLVLGDMLKKIAQTASSGSEACELGQSNDAAEIVDLLKKNVLLIAELVDSLNLSDPSGPSSAISSPPPRSRQPPALISAPMDPPQQNLLNQQPTFSAPLSTASSETNLAVIDPSDMSRKRCASSVAGDRAMKAPKLEPQDDIILQNPPPPVVGIQSLPPPSVLPASASVVGSFPFPQATIPPIASNVEQQPSLPPSVPASRPQSPSRMAHPSMNMLSDFQHANPTIAPVAMHTPLPFPPIDPLQTIPQSANEFVPVAAPPLAPASVNPVPVSPPSAAGFGPGPGLTSPSWPDARPAGMSRHQHTLSGNSGLPGGIVVPHSAMAVTNGAQSLVYPPGPSVSTASGVVVGPPSFASPTRATHQQQQQPTVMPVGSVNVSVPVTVPVPVPVPSSLVSIRSSRSSSLSHPNPFAFSHPGGDIVSGPSVVSSSVAAAIYESMQPSRPSTSGLYSTRPSSPDYENDADGEGDSDDGEGSYEGHHHQQFSQQQQHQMALQHSPPIAFGMVEDLKPGDPGMEGIVASSSSSSGQSGPGGVRRMSRTSPPSEGAGGSHVNEVPAEYRAEVERIFFEFLIKTCSNLDATDAKGEPIHQTLMAKKMQRLDESPDFRPFKFRIQAFTNAFLEELARQGYPEEKIPMKKIRNFLWNQPYISRFNEEGKKSKSKGNHIWHVDAKKTEGGWMFRPFQRRLAGAPPGVAYVGLRWTWTPRIWDPQASRTNMPVTYSSQSLPGWLSWKDDVLSGIPPHDAQSCDVTVEARFMQDGKEEVLTHTVHISIAPMAAVDASFAPSRRPSLVGDVQLPRRVMSDTVLPQTNPTRFVPSLKSPHPSHSS
ncbi:hypothetical protein NLI96_g11276 [Meripilus lineatus]|uniref:Uncharacterized protein n=1 Tax=Meripilus lineatus TaxID=2056292 RepID=A0AAD5UTI2_9APHY|nr:hypothetical protein NLI96_g11276 [Physisporinus lineatus]